MNNLSKYEPEDYYINEEGYVVFTAIYLLKKGYCCDNGCKHCPYSYREKKNKTSKDPAKNDL